MDKFKELLKALGIDITKDDIKKKLDSDDFKKVHEEKWPKEADTKDLLTQSQVNEIVKNRLARQEKVHEAEIKELQEKTKGLLDPSKVKEYEDKVKELETKSKESQATLKKEYELKLAATKAGVKDPDYIDYLAQKEKLYDRIKVNDDGTLAVTDAQGNVLTEDGKKLGPEKLIAELKESKPDLFGESGDDTIQSPWSPGPTNPPFTGPDNSKEGAFGKKIAEVEKQSTGSVNKGQDHYFKGSDE